MSESRVEKLLEQMSLKRPSMELDKRVAELAPRAVVPLKHSGISSVGWKFVSAVAVACLMVGVVVGRTTVSSKTVATNWTPLARSIDANLPSRDSKAVLASVQGPPVAMLCSMSGQTSSVGMLTDQNPHATEGVRCSKCHLGVTEPPHEPSFDHGMAHVNKSHRQLCLRCHVGLEDWDADAFSEIFRAQPREDKLKKSPTG